MTDESIEAQIAALRARVTASEQREMETKALLERVLCIVEELEARLSQIDAA